MKGKHNNHIKSENHYRWNNSIISEHGYKKIRVGKKHILADSNGYAYEHLLIWISNGNKYLQKNELLHHKNDNKTDNRIENLTIISRSEHNKIHNKRKIRNSKGQFKKNDY